MTFENWIVGDCFVLITLCLCTVHELFMYIVQRTLIHECAGIYYLFTGLYKNTYGV